MLQQTGRRPGLTESHPNSAWGIAAPDTSVPKPESWPTSFIGHPPLEGFWSLLRSWLRPHRGISQERLPLYLGFFEFVHNIRRRGKALLGSLIGLLVAPRNPG